MKFVTPALNFPLGSLMLLLSGLLLRLART